MNGERLVVVHPDPGVLADAVAARLLTRILDVQSVRSPVHVVLTGGTVGIATLAAVARHPVRDAVDWSGVHLWWGDERFLTVGDADRNETQARRALIDLLPHLPEENVHPMPAFGPATSTGTATKTAATPEAAAAAYAETLAAFASPGRAVPAFDVVLLGMGPDGHVASLFPGHRALDVEGVATAGVHASPKPPPERVTLTFEAIACAREVWVVAAGAEKASAARRALAGAPVHEVPAAGAVGLDRTLWLLDAAAAGAAPGPGTADLP